MPPESGISNRESGISHPQSSAAEPDDDRDAFGSPAFSRDEYLGRMEQLFGAEVRKLAELIWERMTI